MTKILFIEKKVKQLNIKALLEFGTEIWGIDLLAIQVTHNFIMFRSFDDGMVTKIGKKKNQNARFKLWDL